jgi:hypothetical protein
MIIQSLHTQAGVSAATNTGEQQQANAIAVTAKQHNFIIVSRSTSTRN